jgi:hypothetical protein
MSHTISDSEIQTFVLFAQSYLTKIYPHIAFPNLFDTIYSLYTNKKKTTDLLGLHQCQYIFKQGQKLNQQCTVKVASGKWCSKHKKNAEVKVTDAFHKELIINLQSIEDEEPVIECDASTDTSDDADSSDDVGSVSEEDVVASESDTDESESTIETDVDFEEEEFTF